MESVAIKKTQIKPTQFANALFTLFHLKPKKKSTTIITPILLHIPLSHHRPYPPPFDRNLANPTMESTTINIYQTKSYQNPTKTPKSEINLKTPKKKYTKIACL